MNENPWRKPGSLHFQRIRLHHASRSDCTPVRPCTRERNRNRILPRPDIFQQRRPVIHIHDEDFGAAVAIQIASRQTA